jgi:hypothetical protein
MNALSCSMRGVAVVSMMSLLLVEKFLKELNPSSLSFLLIPYIGSSRVIPPCFMLCGDNHPVQICTDAKVFEKAS